ncbi:hypothetical protein LMG28614_05631 [Paraburkholderia ultramafica]|uniref:Uncharacterized protein n=2 Tax=Paraburkholderia ultramafica TaxID=1544867 RepID=A0A6S7BJK5_9BURK|nr:hypothetical protein LMG28614_05631 [Paraburkholderia ultramafica]
MAVEHDGKTAFNWGTFDSYELARSIAYLVEEDDEKAKIKPSASRKVDAFPITSALYIELFDHEHPMRQSFDLTEANRNIIWVEGIKGWGTAEEAQAFPPKSAKKAAETQPKMTAQEKAAMLGVTVSSIFYHKKPVGSPLTDQEKLVLDHDWAAYQAKTSKKATASKTKEAYLESRQKIAAEVRERARGHTT